MAGALLAAPGVGGSGGSSTGADPQESCKSQDISIDDG